MTISLYRQQHQGPAWGLGVDGWKAGLRGSATQSPNVSGWPHQDSWIFFMVALRSPRMSVSKSQGGHCIIWPQKSKNITSVTFYWSRESLKAGLVQGEGTAPLNGRSSKNVQPPCPWHSLLFSCLRLERINISSWHWKNLWTGSFFLSSSCSTSYVPLLLPLLSFSPCHILNPIGQSPCPLHQLPNWRAILLRSQQVLQ